MADNVESSLAVPAVLTLKKDEKAQKTRSKESYPPTSEMVYTAIATLNERGGSSLKAIKKYIVATYNVDVEKQVFFIRKYIKAAVASNVLIQDKGAVGSFKLNVTKFESKVKVKPNIKTAAKIKMCRNKGQ
ncbi:histone H1B-like [Leptopilina heterotoma]|uniref:histone H1B-like n=1 Tax=Leptopilina heterotoma TaxID=63436 RepID=UPI001CA95085|nr:histone H1B-like [Leptopilina heterotoma]